MFLEVQKIFSELLQKIEQLPINEFFISSESGQGLRSQQIDALIEKELREKDSTIKSRIQNEFYDFGPLTELLKQDEVSEILINGPHSIWFEKKGQLSQHQDQFLSDFTFRNIVEKICQEAKIHTTSQAPCADGAFRDFRLSIVSADLTQSHFHFTLRRHPKNPWTFEKLQSENWCEEAALSFFRDILEKRKNFLIIGSTGSGKTSTLNAFLQDLPESERVVVIEDTSEIAIPNLVSMKLLTREDPHGNLPDIDQSQLLRRSLRLRPDRLVMGEIRGSEAKDFLMALSTGHSGSFGTLHAGDAAQALIRLEMLIQMGAPQWGLTAIRRLIQLSLDYILVIERNSRGKRVFTSAYEISSLEESGFLLERISFSPEDSPLHWEFRKSAQI